MQVDWNKVIESAIGPLLGTLIGGGLTIISLYFKERFDRKKEVQSWFEQQYITKGLDVLLSYIQLSSIHLHTKIMKGSEAELDQTGLGRPPSEAIIRVISLTSYGSITGVMTEIVFTLENVLCKETNSEKLKALNELLDSLISYFYVLRSELRKIALRRKADVYDLWEKNAQISAALKVIERDLENALSKYERTIAGGFKQPVESNLQSEGNKSQIKL
jgi:hypothetical protein